MFRLLDVFYWLASTSLNQGKKIYRIHFKLKICLKIAFETTENLETDLGFKMLCIGIKEQCWFIDYYFNFIPKSFGHPIFSCCPGHKIIHLITLKSTLIITFPATNIRQFKLLKAGILGPELQLVFISILFSSIIAQDLGTLCAIDFIVQLNVILKCDIKEDILRTKFHHGRWECGALITFMNKWCF